MWGSTAGSIIGPNLMEPALRVGGLFGVSPAASAFLISVAGYALAAILIEILLRPDPLAVARAMHASAASDGRSSRRARSARSSATSGCSWRSRPSPSASSS